MRQVAEAATVAVATYERFAEQEPDVALQMLSRHLPPAIQVHRGRPESEATHPPISGTRPP